MSKTGKYLLYAALLGAVVAVGFGIALVYKHKDEAANLAQVQAAKDSSDKEAARQKAAALASAQAKADTDTKLTAANSQVADLTTKLTDAQKSSADATAALATANDAAKAAKDSLDVMKKTLGDKTPEQYIADVAKAQADMQAAQSELKILQDSQDGLQKQIADLKDAINRKPGGVMPPGISGKVTFVNRTWNFVVLDVGIANGVVPNGELIVFRKNSFLGKVKVTSAEANSAVADILPNVKGDIQVGDYVLN